MYVKSMYFQSSYSVDCTQPCSFLIINHTHSHTTPSGHILTKDELNILRRLLADYSDEKLTEIRRRFEENQDGDILREEVERSLREKGLTEIADVLKESLVEGNYHLHTHGCGLGYTTLT